MSNISDAYEFWDIESFNADKVSKENPTEEELKWERELNKAKRIHSKTREGSSMRKLIRQYKQRKSAEPEDSKEHPTEDELRWERKMNKARRIHSKTREGSSMRKLIRQYKQRKGAESFGAEGDELQVEIPNKGMSRGGVGHSLRQVFEKLGYHISPIPKKHKGLTYIKTNSNPVITFIYSKYKEVFEKSLKEIGIHEVNFYEVERMPIIASNTKLVEAGFDAESFEADVDWEGKSYTGQINPDDPDLDPVKADRNKDGKLSSWERALGNQVAKGMREGGYSAESFEAECYVCEAEGFEACGCGSEEEPYNSEEFELHDWYDDMSDYGEMINHPVIQEQREEYLEGQKVDMENKLKVADIGKRVELIDSAVKRQRKRTNIHYRPPSSLIPLDAKHPFGEFQYPQIFKWGVLGLIAVGIGYKVASN
jgi:hypothetical protein